MTQASDFLDSQLVDGTSNQINDVNFYLEKVTESTGYVGETSKNGNEVMIYSDGSIIIRIDDEASEYNSIEEYRG